MREHAVIDQNAIRRRAYERWQERGCPIGTADGDWLDAERELRADQSTRSALPLPVAAALPLPVTAVTPSVPRPRRPRSLVTRSSTAPTAQLLAALVANARR